MRYSLSQEIKIVENIVLQIKSTFMGMQTHILKSFCALAQKTRKLSTLYAHYLAQSEIKQFMSHISTNKLSPQILAEDQALKLVSEHELLRDTIYKHDLGLLYTACI